MASRQNEAISVEPVRILRVILHDFVVQDVTHGSTSHRQARVTRVRLLDGIDREEPDRVDRLLDRGNGLRLLHGLDCGGADGGASDQAGS